MLRGTTARPPFGQKIVPIFWPAGKTKVFSGKYYYLKFIRKFLSKLKIVNAILQSSGTCKGVKISPWLFYVWQMKKSFQRGMTGGKKSMSPYMESFNNSKN
jgi:hypothetical protein